MRLRRAHPAICLVVLAAYLLNLALVASGAVLCRGPDSQARLELACDHGHCGTGAETGAEIDHDHDSSESCWCSACPCEDTSLGFSVIATLNRDVDHATVASSSNCVLWCEDPVSPPRACTAFAVLTPPPPGLAEQLRHLRTIVLIV